MAEKPPWRRPASGGRRHALRLRGTSGTKPASMIARSRHRASTASRRGLWALPLPHSSAAGNPRASDRMRKPRRPLTSLRPARCHVYERGTCADGGALSRI